MDELVQRLSQGLHPVAVGGPRPSLVDLKKRLAEAGYVSVKFTSTRGGTDLGIQVDLAATHFDQANFAQGTGTVHIEGALTLNYIPARCVADIDLATLRGLGHLLIQEAQASQRF